MSRPTGVSDTGCGLLKDTTNVAIQNSYGWVWDNQVIRSVEPFVESVEGLLSLLRLIEGHFREDLHPTVQTGIPDLFHHLSTED